MKNTDSTQRVVAKGLLHPALPVFIFFLFLLLALGLRFGQSQQDSRQIQAHLDTEAEIMANNLQREFNILLLSLRRNADRLHTNSGISEAQWRRDVRNHLQDFKIYQAIEWIDRDFYIRWIEPQLGVRLAIDDFGVGYSSLSYIKDFPIDLLKIDRSFITQVTERQDDATITSAIINLAHNLGIQVVAEGVETTSQLNFLRQHGCDVAQGYLISRPIPADQLEQWLKPQYAENPL